MLTSAPQTERGGEESNGDATGVPLRITLSGPDAIVAAPDADLVASVLCVGGHDWTTKGGVVRGVAIDVPFSWYDKQIFRFPAKLAPWVWAVLRARGIATTFWSDFPTVPEKVWHAAPPELCALLDDPRAAGLGGVIPTARGSAPEVLIPALLRLFPSRRAVIATPTCRDIDYWRRHLKAAGIPRVVTVADGSRVWHHRSSVLVASLSTLELCRPEDFGLAIVTDVATLRCRLLTTKRVRPHTVWDWPTFPLLRDHRVPAFGFLPAASPLSDVEQLTLMSWFGPLLGNQPRESPVRVRVASAPTRDVRLPSDILDAKRAMWADDARNNHIARLAEETQGFVVVLTASTAQASAIGSRLVGWHIESGVVRGSLPERAIVTEGWLARGGRFAAGTVIDVRAWSALRPDNFVADADVTLIDVGVNDHPEFARRTAERIDHYRRNGWDVEMLNPSPSDQ